MPSDFLEKTLEDIIFENKWRVDERGFTRLFEAHLERQFKLPSGRIIDLLSWDLEGDRLKMKIIELKREQIDEAAFWQGFDYYSEFWCYVNGQFSHVDLTLVLCGSSVCSKVMELTLITGKKLELYTYKYDFEGIVFTKRNILPELNVCKVPSVVQFCNIIREKDCQFQQELDIEIAKVKEEDNALHPHLLNSDWVYTAISEQNSQQVYHTYNSQNG